MISVEQALAKIFALCAPLDDENIALGDAATRVLARHAIAAQDLPPFAASAMDGYALNGVEADPEAMFRIIGEAAAGHAFAGRVGAGECVRIFTGAPVPEGANRVIKQEQATAKGNLLTLARDLSPRAHIRPAGSYFSTGDQLDAPRLLGPADLSLLASMNIANVTVARRPEVVILPTGDELVMPGETPRGDQIIASNPFGLRALFQDAGAIVRILPIARDNQAALKASFEMAKDADLIVTTGGASVGEYDLVSDVAQGLGLTPKFENVNIHPGRHMMAGKLGKSTLIALPGTPYAAMACARIFVVPAIRALLGLGQNPAKCMRAPLAAALSAAGDREQYLNAEIGPDGIQVLAKQRGSQIATHIMVNALMRRPANDCARNIGDMVEYLPV